MWYRVLCLLGLHQWHINQRSDEVAYFNQYGKLPVLDGWCGRCGKHRVFAD